MPGSTARAKGKEAKLCFMGHVLMENRNGLVVDGRAQQATGTAEREAAEAMLGDVPGAAADHPRRRQGLRHAPASSPRCASCKVTPHVAQNTSNRALGHRRPDHPASRLCDQPAHPQADRGGVRLDQGDRPARQTRHRGLERVGWQFTLAAAAYNLIRLPKLLAAA